MAKVKNLKIQLQSGTDNTYFASWEFTTTSSSSNGVKVGDLVSISSGATYYNGVSIPAWVKSDKWYVTHVSGDRAVLGKNQSGSHNIQSPVNTKYLTKGSSSSSVASNTLDHYEVKWQYDTGNNVWFEGSSSTTNYKNATYSPPDNALNIRVYVKPVSKTYTENNKEKSYWTGENVVYKLRLAGTAPETPSTPSVEIENYKITATVEGIQDARTDKIEFLIYNVKGKVVKNSGQVTVINQRATYSCKVDVGQYQVKCRAVNIYSKSKLYSSFSDFSGVLTTAPASPKKFTSIKALSDSAVQLDWPDVSGATTYEIEYTTKQRYFDSSSEVSSTSIDAKVASHAEIIRLDLGEKYFFRIRARNDQGASAWSSISSIIIGKKPAAPTTWSSSTTAIAGTDLNLYWVHNSEDGSSQTYADLELYINGVKQDLDPIKNTTDEDEKDKTSVYSIDTSSYVEGTKIEWRVRTRGVLPEYGDWSIQRTIDIYGTPTLQLSVTDSTDEEVTDTLTSFPFYIRALAGPQTQAPIGYHVSIIANESYEDIDNVGNIQTISEGSEVYSKYYDTNNNPLELELTAGSVNLENNISYTIIVTASMNSGLTATESFEFTVAWMDETYIVDARISIDEDTLVAYIAPYCTDEDGVFVDNVLISVYRREYDGNFTEISSDMDNSLNATVTDPHPALDYARYRIVAKDTTTGAITYYDVPGQPIGEKSVVIQWDESWTWYDVENEDEMVEPPWAGSMLKLPYNIDISDSNNKDVSLVSYIGRKHPVSYYGTQLGVTSTWNVEIEKSDAETLYALRRLAIWTGDVYVREPSGSGYWANISVSFNQKHCEVTIPVTLNITRVEGGM
jgi:hypothetical protein